MEKLEAGEVKIIQTVFEKTDMKAFLSLWCIAAAVVVSSSAFAAPEKNNIYELSLTELSKLNVTIATGNATPLDKAPASASVLSSADIAATGAKTLDDLLALIPGVHVAPSSLSRMDSVYYIRGLNTGFNPQVLLMLNGTPIQNAVQGGRPTLFKLPVASIERIEVIRGPGSAIYGADAYAGVVNVITKDFSTLPREQVEVKTGSFNSQEYNFSGATNWKDLQVSLVMSYQTTDGDDSRVVSSDLQTTLDQFFGTSASLAPGSLRTAYQVLDTHFNLQSESWNFNLWNWQLRDAEIGAGGAQALDENGKETGDIVMADFTYDFQPITENLKTRLKLSAFKYDQESYFQLFPSGSVVPIGIDGNINAQAPVGVVMFTEGVIGNPSGTVEDLQWEVISIYSGLESHQFRVAFGSRDINEKNVKELKNFGPGILDVPVLPLAVGGELTDVSGTEFVFIQPQKREVNYLSLQDEWAITSALNLTAGVRYDDYSDFGSTVNPRLALVWSTTDSFVTKFLYGSAFRAPSLTELYMRNNPSVLGNELLQAEDIDTTELSFNWQITDNLNSILTLFDYDARDLVNFELNTENSGRVAQNSLSQSAQGFEWEVNWYLSNHFRINTSYSHHDATNDLTDTKVADTPRHLGKLNLTYQFLETWMVSTQAFYVGSRERRVGDARDQLKDYWLLNANLIKNDMLPNTDLHLGIRNLLDEDIREPSTGEIPEDYPMESRSVWLGVTVSF